MGAETDNRTTCVPGMHSVRRHELGVRGLIPAREIIRCIPCGDMSWESSNKGEDFRCVIDAFRAET